MKPFEIQSADLKLGGVTLQAGNTGVVIPGVTQATNYKVEEVDDTDVDQTRMFSSAPMVIDYITAQDLNNTGTTSNRATYSVEIDDDDYIDEIEADSSGSYTSQESQTNASNTMLAYIGSDSDPLVNWNFQDWVTIPFRPKMRAGEVERIGGDGGATSLEELEDVQLEVPSNGQVLTWNASQEKWENQDPTTGNDGAPGQGVPTGGTAGQVLAKINGDDYNTEWVTLTGGSDTDGDPAYKGFKASYGRMWGNNSGPINKIVIYKDTATPSSTIDTSTNNDDFTVTGLSGSDVVVMLVAIGEDQNQTTTAELKTFAESVIDNVILNGGVEGDVNTAAAMRTAFYDNFATFSATLTDLKANFQFFGSPNSPQYTINNFTYNGFTGTGASFGSLQYVFANSRFEIGSWSNGSGYLVGDFFTILGTDIVDVATGLTLASPANDTTITVASVHDGGYLNTFTITSGIPVPADPGPNWPSNYIGDGGDDEYDDGNYINTNLESNISYNSGNVVSGSSAFGGGDYVVTYQNSIFGIFAVNSSIDSIATQGGSGFDGSGQADTGSLYGAASGVSIGDFVFTNSTMTSPDDDLYIKAVDDLWLDALDDDVHIRANDDVRIKAGYNFDDDDAQAEWRFSNDGIINFPDGSEQSTAWNGNVDYYNINNRPNIPSSLTDLLGFNVGNRQFLRYNGTTGQFEASSDFRVVPFSTVAYPNGTLDQDLVGDVAFDQDAIYYCFQQPNAYSISYGGSTNWNPEGWLRINSIGPNNKIPQVGDKLTDGSTTSTITSIEAPWQDQGGGATFMLINISPAVSAWKNGSGDLTVYTGLAPLTQCWTKFSKSYNDLTNKPTIPADVSDLTDTTGLLGATGPQGPQGETGPQGPAGASGNNTPTFSVQNSNFTAVAGTYYAVDTTAGQVTATLPANPSVGQSVHFVDAGGAWPTNKIRIVTLDDTVQTLIYGSVYGNGTTYPVFSFGGVLIGFFWTGSAWRRWA